MNALPLAPLPTESSPAAESAQWEREKSFVDEAAVLSVIARGTYERPLVQPEGLVLSSNEEDYAGWSLQVSSPFRDLGHIENSPLPAANVKRPAPPLIDSDGDFSETGLAEPHQGAHRWWMFGLTGALTCGIFSLTLLALAQRTVVVEEIIAGYIPVTPRTKVVDTTPVNEENPPALVRIDSVD
ncbi:MAG: hypothetical protein ACSHX7_02390 [Luteolibacter sp.]